MEDTNRLEELVTKYENTLFRAALAILREPQEAQDAVQDAYVRYLEKRPRFQDGEHAKAWLLKVTATAARAACAPGSGTLRWSCWTSTPPQTRTAGSW